MRKCYEELSQLLTFKERYEYLRLDGVVGEETFGFDRYLNQIFYNSKEWKDIRRKIIIRDNGCDLGLDGYEIRGKILIHHMNPIRQQDILLRTDLVLNPEYLITTTLGELKKLSEERMLLFDEDLMTFAMGNCITLEDTNGNRKLLKKRYEQKIDAVAAMMDAYIAFKANREAFE